MGRCWGLVVAVWLCAGCSREPATAPANTPKTAPAVRITQFYSTAPQANKGEAALVCYGVENASKVWLEPPRQELSSALARCVEVSPSGTTSYTLTAEGADGKTVSQTLEVTVGPSRAKIVEVRVSALQVSRGAPVSICYQVRNAQSIRIEPIGFQSKRDQACTVHQPQQTTTYVVTASGAGGSTDYERVTVKVN